MANKKLANRGKNIADTLDVNLNTSPDAKALALRRTMLIKSLNTGRCTSPQEMQERFENLFEMAFKNNFVPTVEALALCSRLGQKNS